MNRPTVSDDMVLHAHAAWLIALADLAGVTVIMTTEQAQAALRPAIAAALKHSPLAAGERNG